VYNGDIITRIGGTGIDADHSFINTMFLYQPGQQVTIELARGTEKIEVQEVILGESSTR
jgi:S1-C subfamily serine protease